MRSFVRRFALVVLACALTTVGGVVPATAAQATQRATVNLRTLTCYETEDLTGGDNVYLKINGQTVWSAADSVDCDHDNPKTLPVNRLARTGDTVSLYDDDWPDGDDHLGSDTVEGDRGSLFFNLDGALYTLDYGPA